MKVETWTLADGENSVSLSVEIASTWWSRFKGLMLRKPLPEGRGLFLEKTNSIHMCFMRFAIDAIYFDGDYRVVKVVHHLHPWLGLSAAMKAKGCLEMKAGEAKRLGITAGMKKVRSEEWRCGTKIKSATDF